MENAAGSSRGETSQQRRRMAFGVDPFNEVEPLWWELLEECDDYRVWRMEIAITYQEIQEHGFAIGPNDLGKMIIWLRNSFAWHAFGYREENYVQSVALLKEPDSDTCIHPVIFVDPEW